MDDSDGRGLNAFWCISAFIVLGAILVTNKVLAQTTEPSVDSVRCLPIDAPLERPSASSPASGIPRLEPSKILEAQKACWITLAQVDLQARPQQPLYWVDIRSLRAANALPLAGSLRLAPDEITLKPFLRRGTIILIGTGLDDVAVETTCSTLLDAGISSVRALRGGARAWRAAGRPIVLNTQSVDSDEMDILDFISGAARERWPVIALDLPPTASLPIPVSRLARVSSKKIWSPARLFPAHARQKMPVIVLAPDMLSSQRLRAQTSRRARGDTMETVWVRGGYAAYHEAITQQRAIAANRDRSLRPPCGAVDSRESPL